MDDDDDEDFRALFFTECEELLSDLQEHLDLLHNGEGDKETLNAAFRAVHSVKGGAAAFGFDDLQLTHPPAQRPGHQRLRAQKDNAAPGDGQAILAHGHLFASFPEQGHQTASIRFHEILSPQRKNNAIRG